MVCAKCFSEVTKESDLDSHYQSLTSIPGRQFTLLQMMYGAVCSSQMTSLEKLDVMYDIADLTEEVGLGIDQDQAMVIIDTVLATHQIYIPNSELKASIELIHNQGS